MKKNKKKINKRTREKRELIKETIIGFVVLIIIQFLVVAFFVHAKYQNQQADSDNTYTKTIHVDEVYHMPRHIGSSIYVYSGDTKWDLSETLATKHTEKSVKELCQKLEGTSLNIVYKREFVRWRWTNVVVEAYDDSIVYYTIDEYNDERKVTEIAMLICWVALEIVYVFCAGLWIIFKIAEWKFIVMSSKKKKTSN